MIRKVSLYLSHSWPIMTLFGVKKAWKYVSRGHDLHTLESASDLPVNPVWWSHSKNIFERKAKKSTHANFGLFWSLMIDVNNLKQKNQTSNFHRYLVNIVVHIQAKYKKWIKAEGPYDLKKKQLKDENEGRQRRTDGRFNIG